LKRKAWRVNIKGKDREGGAQLEFVTRLCYLPLFIQMLSTTIQSCRLVVNKLTGDLGNSVTFRYQGMED